MFIYKTTNKINGKIYIGKLVRESKVYLGSGKILKLSVEKYGRDNFTREIIEYCDCKTQLIEREKFWIKHYNSMDRNIGYNLTKGGDGGSTNNFFLNKKLTPEHKLKISQNHHDVSGEKNPMFGKNHTELSKEKMSLNTKGFKHSQSTIQKFKIRSQGENNSNSKLTESIVKQIRIDYNSGITHKELSIKYNVKPPCIWKIINRITWKNT
jgi:group I intron endonuclease